MSAGVPKYVTINLGQLAERFTEGEEVSLATLKAKRVLNLSGKEAKLPLKVHPFYCFSPVIIGDIGAACARRRRVGCGAVLWETSLSKCTCPALCVVWPGIPGDRTRW